MNNYSKCRITKRGLFIQSTEPSMIPVDKSITFLFGAYIKSNITISKFSNCTSSYHWLVWACTEVQFNHQSIESLLNLWDCLLVKGHRTFIT